MSTALNQEYFGIGTDEDDPGNPTSTRWLAMGGDATVAWEKVCDMLNGWLIGRADGDLLSQQMPHSIKVAIEELGMELEKEGRF